MKSVIVRPFEDSDLADAAAALVDVHTTDGYPVEGVEEPETWLRSADVIAAWVGELDGAVVGHVAIMRPHGEDAVSLWMQQSGDKEDQIAVLARLFVVKSARKHAVGESLMQAAMSYADEHGIRLVLDVMTKDTAAMRLYERLGWREIGRAPHHYGSGQSIDAVCYVAPSS
ncbi:MULTISPECIES: GNAT family N-acetyltransferase [unclassified Streptomyces]|uniref:GNAT family N-acetyltransferase n=1 Tax=unclassified Streptomyces TaxID=2593676 RepID=UPI00247679B5|nr:MULTISPECIES: GNAT family N-acetyltransferase [unclassified Streptomyces]MDH6450184.1 ribosomal protein S18 acetylase RimI-like enzyme [Streptomyces sp. SAI-119]MDH6499271.1 ribosomal protein S18 acetylase RimI-like enzyme [Streptomyces sp. SAI-149]